MSAKAIRVDAISYDARMKAYRAQVTLAGQHGPELRTVTAKGHPSWSPTQIVQALASRAAQ